MLYAFVQDLAASWHEYERVAADVADPTARGLIVHVAGATDQGVRMVEVWESRDAWLRFSKERQARAVAALTRLSRLEPTFRDVHGTHVVFDAPSLRGRRKEPQ